MAYLRGSVAVSERISAALPKLAMSSIVLGEWLSAFAHPTARMKIASGFTILRNRVVFFEDEAPAMGVTRADQACH